MALGIFLISIDPGYAPDLNKLPVRQHPFRAAEYLDINCGARSADPWVGLAAVLKSFSGVVDEEFSLVIGVPVQGPCCSLLSLTALHGRAC